MDYPCNGFQPSPKDPKDWKIEKLMGVGFDETLLTPASHDFRDKNHAILNQLSTQSCVGHCIAQAAYTAMNVAGRTGEYLFLPSPLKIYYDSRANHDAEKVDEGTRFSAAFCGMRKFGLCPNDLWPLDVAKVNKQPPWRAYRAAADYRWLDGYYLISQTGTARCQRVKEALAKSLSIVFGMAVDAGFKKTKGRYGVPTGPIIGRHGMCISGYDQEGIWVPNSWGTGYGDGGYVHLDWDVVAWDEAVDFRVLTVVPL